MHEGRLDTDQFYVQKGEGANLFAWKKKGQRPSLIMGRTPPQSKHMTRHAKIIIIITIIIIIIIY